MLQWLFKSRRSSHCPPAVSIKDRLAHVRRILLIYPNDVANARVVRYTLARFFNETVPYEVFVAARESVSKYIIGPAEHRLPIQLNRSGVTRLASIDGWQTREFDALVCLEPNPGDDLMNLIQALEVPVTVGFFSLDAPHCFTIELVKRPTEFLENSYGSVLGLFGLKAKRH